jgi:flagellar secretion chaperone FliS
MSPMELAYRKTAAAGSSGYGLLIALYDTLAGDLRRAAEAERSNNVEKRSREANHALLVIGFLEDRLANGSGGELADRLTAFYRSLRHKLIQAQAKRSAELIEQMMALVLEFRGQWQAMEFKCTSVPEPEILAPAQTQLYGSLRPARTAHTQSSWLA